MLSRILPNLPLVVQEAITFLKDIGQRYLWVDSLCVMQDGDAKMSELDKMGSIYANAYFTIVAAAPEGLVGTTASARDYSIPAKNREGHYSSLLESKWATRGWTFQEQILSTRAVIFLGTYHWQRSYGIRVDGVTFKPPLFNVVHMFWDCQIDCWDDDLLSPNRTNPPAASISDSPSSDAREEPNGDVYRFFKRRERTLWPDFKTYLEFVCVYNERDLTHPQDVIRAITRVFSTLNFPGGLMSGVPQAFLDETMIWQPRSKATKRVPVPIPGMPLSKPMPSWSWSGWQCLLEPQSLSTGLDYSNDSSARRHLLSWQTKPLVNWQLCSEQGGRRLDLVEVGLLYRCRAQMPRFDEAQHEGWLMHSTIDGTEPYFTHVSDKKAQFRYPVPVHSQSTSSPDMSEFPYLSGTVQHATFRVQRFLQYPRRLSRLLVGAPMKMSVFELTKFTECPKEPCSIITLTDTEGWAGVLRVMDNRGVTPGQELGLIAISEGAVSYEDLVSSAIEERIGLLRTVEYGDEDGEPGDPLLWQTTADEFPLELDRRLGPGALLATIQEQCERVLQDEVSRYPGMREVGSAFLGFNSNGRPDYPQRNETYKFYNVMWIEKQDNIVRRLAVGRIQKASWDRCRSLSTQRVMIG